MHRLMAQFNEIDNRLNDDADLMAIGEELIKLRTLAHKEIIESVRLGENTSDHDEVQMNIDEVSSLVRVVDACCDRLIMIDDMLID